MKTNSFEDAGSTFDSKPKRQRKRNSSSDKSNDDIQQKKNGQLHWNGEQSKLKKKLQKRTTGNNK